jgi:hypothetical protein
MILPILLTLITGSIYQIVDIGGKGGDFNWLLDWHKGHFGILNLERIYPFLNALGSGGDKRPQSLMRKGLCPSTLPWKS